MYRKQNREMVFGNVSRRKNSQQQLLSCYFINKTCIINKTSVVHVEIRLTYLAQDKHFV